MAIAAVLFDRDGTLVEDVPYNDDPRRVRACPGAAASVQRLRAAGLRLGVLTNQSGIGRGLLSRDRVEAVNERVDQLVGPFDAWAICPHGPDDGCGCRKPAPGLVHELARQLGVPTSACAVIGDIGSDVAAAHAAGAVGILVPNSATRPEEVASAPLVASDLHEAVELALGGCS